MNKTLIPFLFLCFIFNSGFSQNCTGDLDGFTTLGEFENSTYYMSNHTNTWQNASIEAAALGGYLASIGSIEENIFIKNNLGSTIAFIGFSDDQTEGDFYWDSGEAVTFNSLAQNPNSANNDYGTINFWNGNWILNNKWTYKPFIVEIPCDGGGMNNPCQFTISDVVFPTNIVPGQPFDVEATITNDATTASLPSSVNLYRFFSSNGGTSISSLIQIGGAIPALNAGATTTIQFSLSINAPHYEGDFPLFDGNYKGDYVLMMDGSGDLPEFQSCYYEPVFEVDFVDTDVEISWIDNDGCFGINRIVQADLQVKNLGNNPTVAPIFVYLGSRANVQPNLPGLTYENSEGFDGVYWKINQLLMPDESIVLTRPYKVYSTSATSITFTPFIDEGASNIEDANLSNNNLNTIFIYDDFCTTDLASRITTSIFWDNNSNGVRNLPEDTGVSYNIVQVQDQNNNFVAEVATDIYGNVTFEGLPAGTYRLVYALIQDTGISPKNAPSGTPTTDSDINSDGKTDFFTLSEGQLVDDLAAGFVPDFFPEGSITVQTWFDQTGDGIRNFADNAISGVSIQLEDSNGTTIYNAMTNSNGEIIFDDLPTGQYRVITESPTGRMPTLKNVAGSTADNDSDLKMDGTTDLITLGAGEIISNIGAGYRTINNETDIELSLTVDNQNPALYQKVNMTYTIENTSQNMATNLSVKVGVCNVVPSNNINNIGFFSQATGLVNTSPSPIVSLGSYNQTSQFWTIPQLAAGTSATLTVTIFVLTTEERTLVGEVILGSPFDIDSAYGNMVNCTVQEDDEVAFILNEEDPPTENAPCQLSISNLVFPSVVQPGETITVSATITNDGTQTSLPAQLSLYQPILQPDGDLSYFVIVEDGVLVPTLASGASTNIQFQVNLPNPLYVDMFNPENVLFQYFGNYLLMIADDATNVFQDNCFAELDFEVDFINTDLSIEFVNNGGCYGNGIFDTELQLTNHGNVATTAPIYIKLDANFPFIFVDQSLPYIYYNPANIEAYLKITETLQAGEVFTFESPFTAFDEYGADIELTMTILTEQSNIDDAVTANNIAISNFVQDDNCGIQFNGPCQFDISNVVFPDIVQPGETLTLQADVTNIGDHTSAADYINLYQLIDRPIGPPLLEEIQIGAAIPALAEGATTTIQFQVTIPMPHYVGQPVPTINSSYTYGNYTLVAESGNYLICQTLLDFEVDFINGDLELSFVNNNACYGTDGIVQTDLQVTNVGNNTVIAPIFVKIGTFSDIVTGLENVIFNPVGDAYWKVPVLLSPGQFAQLENPYNTNNNTNSDITFSPFIDNDISNIEDLDNSNNSVTTTVVFDENCTIDPTCDYQNSPWVIGLLADNAALCAGINIEINAYQYNGDIFIGIISDHIAYDSPLQSIYSCDGTLSCLNQDVVGVPNCGYDWFNNSVLIEQLWSRTDDCIITGDGVDLELDIVAPSTYVIYNNLTFQYSVFNNGTENAENVVVDVPLPEGFVHSDNSATHGAYDLFLEKWEAGTIKVGETAVLDLSLFALTSGAVTVYSQITIASPDDLDSTPNNGTCCTPNEDDEAAITIGNNFQNGNGNTAFLAPNTSLDLEIKTIYPNVVNNEMTIFVQSKLSTLQLRVYNLQGHEVLQQKYQDTAGFRRLPLDVSSLPIGTYFVRFEGTSGQQTKRFVKIKM